jgi:hypothetical protein
MNEEQDIKIDFMYTDNFGQESRLIKNFSPCVLIDQTHFELLVGEFKSFMRASGFDESLVDTIQIVDLEI